MDKLLNHSHALLEQSAENGEADQKSCCLQNWIFHRRGHLDGDLQPANTLFPALPREPLKHVRLKYWEYPYPRRSDRHNLATLQQVQALYVQYVLWKRGHSITAGAFIHLDADVRDPRLGIGVNVSDCGCWNRHVLTKKCWEPGFVGCILITLPPMGAGNGHAMAVCTPSWRRAHQCNRPDPQPPLPAPVGPSLPFWGEDTTIEGGGGGGLSRVSQVLMKGTYGNATEDLFVMISCVSVLCLQSLKHASTSPQRGGGWGGGWGVQRDMSTWLFIGAKEDGEGGGGLAQGFGTDGEGGGG